MPNENSMPVDYRPGDKVKIPELNRDGRVVGIYIGKQATEYQVRYFDNGDAKTTYFLPEELERREQ